MLTNPEARAKEQQEKVEYEWGTLWPHYHKDKVTWATGIRTRGDVDILFLSGETGRDPLEDVNPLSVEDERRTRVVGGIKEQTRQCLWAIKGNLEMMGASLKHIVMFRWFVKRREDIYAMREERDRFFAEFEPDLLEHRRCGTLLCDVGLFLPEMLIEIEAWAAVPRQTGQREPHER
jgi:enamine deaminase RidA (YjgF/YER057c/UK114 family)